MAGVAAVKQESDVLLYYRLDGWETYAGTGGVRNVSSTMEVLDFRYCESDCATDGEGLLMIPSPKGVLSTLQLENIRDGLEDVEWYAVLSQLLADASARGIDVSNETIASHVADIVFSHVQWSDNAKNFTFTTSPAVFRAERDKVAAAIKSVKHKLHSARDVVV